MEIRPIGTKLFQADGRTQSVVMKLKVAFRNFAESAQKN